MINPDLIKVGDQVMLSVLGSVPLSYTVARRQGTKLVVEAYGGGFKTVRLAGRYADCTIVAHQARPC